MLPSSHSYQLQWQSLHKWADLKHISLRGRQRKKRKPTSKSSESQYRTLHSSASTNITVVSHVRDRDDNQRAVCPGEKATGRHKYINASLYHRMHVATHPYRMPNTIVPTSVRPANGQTKVITAASSALGTIVLTAPMRSPIMPTIKRPMPGFARHNGGKQVSARKDEIGSCTHQSQH